MDGQRKGHRQFAAFWAWTAAHEGGRQRAARRLIVEGASGDVLEIGFGVGTNWEFLPASVRYTGIEPDPYMLERARKNANDTDHELALVDAAAEDLPFADDSFDTVVSTLTFCTVADVPRALDEIARVLRPGGEFRFFEHVQPRGRLASGISSLITPAWKRIGGGCHPNRRTLHDIREHGYAVRLVQPRSGPFGMMAVGVATPAPVEMAR